MSKKSETSHMEENGGSKHGELRPDPDARAAGVPDDPLTGHSYDGIQEFDNPLPGWWKWLFVATIVFAFPYAAYYHSGAEGRSVEDQYEEALAENLRLQFRTIGEVQADRANVIKFLYMPNVLPIGGSVFKQNCSSCHGSDGGGIVGPNLTDDQYKNVKDIGDILTVVSKGAGAGAMPAWNNRLSTNEIVLVSSYVAALRGTTPEKAKDPEGRIIPPWPGPPEVEDSTANEEAVEGSSEEDTQDSQSSE